MTIIVHMTAEKYRTSISFMKEYSVKAEEAEMCMNDPHTAFDIPKWVIIDDMEFIGTIEEEIEAGYRDPYGVAYGGTDQSLRDNP